MRGFWDSLMGGLWSLNRFRSILVGENLGRGFGAGILF